MDPKSHFYDQLQIRTANASFLSDPVGGKCIYVLMLPRLVPKHAPASCKARVVDFKSPSNHGSYSKRGVRMVRLYIYQNIQCMVNLPTFTRINHQHVGKYSILYIERLE